MTNQEQIAAHLAKDGALRHRELAKRQFAAWLAENTDAEPEQIPVLVRLADQAGLSGSDPIGVWMLAGELRGRWRKETGRRPRLTLED
jgi:hypothetical protein